MHESEKQTRVQLILHRFLEGVRVTALPDCNFSFHGHTKVSYLNSLVLDLVFSRNISVQWGVFPDCGNQEKHASSNWFVFCFFFARPYLLVTVDDMHK